MSDYHIRSRERESNSWKYAVYVHISVPSGDNDAGIPWVTCILEDDEEANISTLPMISSEEKAEIEAGTLLERVHHIGILDGTSQAEALLSLDLAFNNLRANIYDRLSEKYRFWGLERDVA